MDGIIFHSFFLPVLSVGGNPAVVPNWGWKLLLLAAGAAVLLFPAALSTEAKGFPESWRRSSEALSLELLVRVMEEETVVV